MSNSASGSTRFVKIVSNALVSLFAITGILLIAVALFARTDSAGVTRVAGHPVLTVLSDSMTPTFKAGDLLVERPVEDASALSVGDAITFRVGSSNDLVTHRIIRVKGSPAAGDVTYRTQGDANNAPDATPVAPDQVVGVYSTHIPYAGYVLQAARSRAGLFLLFCIPAAALLIPVLVRSWRAAGAADADEPAIRPEEDPELVPGGVRKGVGG